MEPDKKKFIATLTIKRLIIKYGVEIYSVFVIFSELRIMYVLRKITIKNSSTNKNLTRTVFYQ